MQKIGLFFGAVMFFVIAPGTIAGWLPYAITRWRVQSGWPMRIAGGLLLVAGTAVLVDSFLRFVFVGRGTPAPVAPPGVLVASGLYRYVRNPMYVAILTVILGQALLFGSAALLGYAVVVWLLFHSFVMLYEEPTLRRKFGESYEVYCANVRRWRPRATPWTVDY